MYGKTFRMWIGNHMVVVLSDPEDVNVMMSYLKFLFNIYKHLHLVYLNIDIHADFLG